MITHFLNLEWKQFTRSASFGKSLGLKILMGFFALYFIIIFLALGVGMFPMLKKIFPESDPFVMFNSFIFYWILGDLVIRFFFQKLPVMNVKPLLTLPLKRKKVVNFVLGKSALSFFNFLPLFAIVPFGVTLIFKDYNVSVVLVWMLTIVIITLINNYLNFIIESLSAKTELSFLPIILLSGGLFVLNHFEIINISELLAVGIQSIASNPLYLVVPVLILVGLYIFNFKILRDKLFLDSSLKTKTQEVHASNLEWTKKFGDIAPFMQLDLKLLWRNKRPKSSVWMLILGLLYGLVFYPNPEYQDKEFFFAFVGIFITGIFLINFGQFIPAWDSGYYKLLMSQNIKYKQYLKSKYTLMTFSVIILFVLSIPYVYFGWKILLAHFAAAIYNIGVNTHVILIGGSFNRKKINLNERAAFNFQGTGAVQWIIGLPLLILPMAIFGIANWLFSFEIGITVLIFLGVLGIVLHEKLMKFITKKYLASKYKMIAAFDQDN
ncbi:DUF5687 family protein [Formosa algae]|uniref:Uncharacterized protein n=1 Tax=Formosa algae TaxID=225843 RepID=A0A9X1CAV9_9FLAO|nr:DUF5687 family protein [Formosa algae]MBP1838580.1 hypothetical protein [Formosa algae]MDQ0335080.1 hypothetical protein [Formosa algae]OEI79582.1 hypothetical protein AST99_13515 [Formosa algae]